MAVVKLTPVFEQIPKSPDSELVKILDKQREAFLREGAPSAAHRIAAIDKIHRSLIEHKQDILEAISKDFGNRSHHESLMAEVFITINAVKHNRKHLTGWMNPKKAPISWQFKPGYGKIHYQPLGVVGIISPWNYPLQLAFVPIVQALAAGNRIMLKPSELTPATSELMKKMLSENFTPEEVVVVTGDASIGAEFSSLPFDHMFYTGSTKVGRLVMIAAANNMTPVTLELGGKSPCVVGTSGSLDKAVGSIASGKLLNCGQTCVAPDYSFVHEGQLEAFIDGIKKSVSKMYPTLRENSQYTSIVSDGHYERIKRLLADAEEKGAKIVEINPAGEDLSGTRKIAPTLVLDVRDDMDIMQEEIFGPVMPVMTYKEDKEYIDYINKHPRPLALYYFGDDSGKIADIVDSTTSGGVCINDTLFHLAQEELPFGGIGPSGTGAYHGFAGFQTFSHAKSVFYQSKLSSSALLRAPYGKLFERMVNFLIGK